MIPPDTLDVCDAPNFRGFCAITRLGTLWRPESVLTEGKRTRGKPTIGTLKSYTERSFYQTNDDVTMATYKVKGYGYLVAVWFDNQTGERIA